MKCFGHYLALIGEASVRYGDALAQHCADVLVLPSDPETDQRIASHPDTLMAQIGTSLVTSDSYAVRAQTVLNALESRADCRIIHSKKSRTAVYPGDIGCNVLVWGAYLYGLSQHLWPEVLLAAEQEGKTVRCVRQGYAGCCALSAGDLVISADPSVLRAASADGAETLAITPGGIELPGYDVGFIGGASGFCEHTAVFYGTPDRHPDGKRIRAALEERQISVLPLKDAPLFDGGGIRFIPLRRSV